jgi:hypothetical protein
MYLIELTYFIEWEPYYPRLFSNRLQDALSDPPDSVGDEFESSSFIKSLCGLEEPEISFINQIRKGKSLVLILFGDRYDKPQIGFD